MKKTSTARRGFVCGVAGLAGVGWLVSAMLFAANATADATADATTGGTAGHFAQLDAATEQLLNEVVALGAEMAVLKEARELPVKSQLLVLVSVESSPLFQLDAVQLRVGDNEANLHRYTASELAALQQGGSHRLFWGTLPAGQHRLTLSMMGRVPKGPDFQRESTLEIVAGAGRRVVELRVSPGKSPLFPDMTLRERR